MLFIFFIILLHFYLPASIDTSLLLAVLPHQLQSWKYKKIAVSNNKNTPKMTKEGPKSMRNMRVQQKEQALCVGMKFLKKDLGNPSTVACSRRKASLLFLWMSLVSITMRCLSCNSLLNLSSPNSWDCGVTSTDYSLDIVPGIMVQASFLDKTAKIINLSLTGRTWVFS